MKKKKKKSLWDAFKEQRLYFVIFSLPIPVGMESWAVVQGKAARWASSEAPPQFTINGLSHPEGIAHLYFMVPSLWNMNRCHWHPRWHPDGWLALHSRTLKNIFYPSQKNKKLCHGDVEAEKEVSASVLSITFENKSLAANLVVFGSQSF